MTGHVIVADDGPIRVVRLNRLAKKNALTGEMYDALTRQRCVSAVYDDTAIIGQLQSPDWREFEMPLLSIMVEPWGMAVRLGESRLEEALADQVKEWHRTGRIVALEEQWRIPHSGFAEEMHRKYTETE